MRILIYYTNAFLQGLALLIIPAAASIFKAQEENAISDAQYGLLSLPMISAAILSTFFLKHILAYIKRSQVYFLGIACNAAYMLLASSSYLTRGGSAEDIQLSFILLMSANFMLGAGFGLLLSMLNTLVVDIAPKKSDALLTALHACLGIGAALAPQLVRFFHQMGAWQISALCISLMFVFMALSSITILGAIGKAPQLPEGQSSARSPKKSKESLVSKAGFRSKESLVSKAGFRSKESLVSKAGFRSKESLVSKAGFPGHAWFFLFLIMLYAIIETTINYWTGDYLHKEKGLRIEDGLEALSIFWAFVTAGRALASLITLRIDGWYLYLLSPVLIFCAVSLVLAADPSLIFISYMLLGLGCSYFFPLSISLATRSFPQWQEQISALSLAALMAGIGFGNFVVGALKTANVISLKLAFESAAFLSLALLLGLFWLFFALKKKQARPAIRHAKASLSNTKSCRR